MTFFKFRPQNLLHSKNVPIKCPKQFLCYNEFICRKTCESKFRPPKSTCFFKKFMAEQVLKSFLGRKNSLKSPVFEFSNSLPFVHEESRELRALIR